MQNKTRLSYRSADGRHDFNFEFVVGASEVTVYCTKYPVPKGRSQAAQRTHIFDSGKLCFVKERAPKTLKRAKELARQWAEYILEYAKTGVAQS